MKIVFLGTPDFAVASLKAIIDHGFDVVAVVTAPDKPAGRGMHLQISAVKKFALEKNIPVLQPIKLKDEAFIEALKNYHADLQVVIAFRMLPEVIWNMPKLGTVNLHASLLPDYRGAAPINWAVINGETETGVSTFFLKHDIDTGDIILSKKVAITDEMNAGELHDILMNTGADVIVETLIAIENNSFKSTPQKKDSNKIAPKIFTEHCKINWNNEGENIRNLIRGMSPYPGAFTELEGKILKIFDCDFKEDNEIKNQPGVFETDGKTFLKFACNNGWINLKNVQLSGKKRMNIDELLRGYRIGN
ncbi:MAG: methionyl-tRNA formyltransferase [Bacteroidota bacterium]